MEKALVFQSVDEVRIGKILRFIIPTYLTSLFNTVYTMVDGIFVSICVGTDALAAINIVYPIVNILTGIALAFATGGSAIAAIHIGGNEKAKANQAFMVSMALSVMANCLIAVLIGQWEMGIRGAAIAITTVVFNKTAMAFAGEDGIAAVSIIMYLQFLFIGIYFGFSMGIAPPQGYAYGNNKHEVCKRLEKYAYCFLTGASIIIYALAFFLAPVCTLFFAGRSSSVYLMAVSGMRLYGLGFLFSGFNIFFAVRMMAYGKGYYSGIITFFRSFAFLLLFLKVLPGCWGIRGIWLAVPMSGFLTLLMLVGYMIFKGDCKTCQAHSQS